MSTARQAASRITSIVVGLVYGDRRIHISDTTNEFEPIIQSAIDAAIPAWHACPTCAGWWLHWHQGEIFYVKKSDLKHDDAHRFSDQSDQRVYGPIPEPPEMPT